jgi:acetyl esterase/lipase
MSSFSWVLWIGIPGLLALATLTACQPTRVLNAVVPEGAFTVEKDLKYGDNARQTLDIYFPADRPPKETIVVFVYGGSWDSGSKDDFLFVGQAFARLGYITVIPDYRIYPGVIFPAFIDDVALATGQLDRLIPATQGMQRNIILAGHSAGAHTAALLATDSKYLERHGVQRSRVQGLIGLAGPYDLPLQNEEVVDKFSNVEGDEANPVSLATADVAPSLLLHGSADDVAEPEHSIRFAQRLQELGVPVESHFYKRVGHVSLVAGLASPLRFLHGAYAEIEGFLEQYAGN